MKPTDVQYIVVHCSATSPRQDIGAKEIDEMHRARGFSRLGYHSVIRRNGGIEGGRSLNEIGAHTKGHNYHSWGVCLVGGIDQHGKPENNFTPEQMASLRVLLRDWHGMAPHARILGHRDLSPDIDGDGVVERHEWLKDCPCFDVGEWLAMDTTH